MSFLRNYIFFLLIASISLSCGKRHRNEFEKDPDSNFFIRVKEFSDRHKADEFASELRDRLAGHISIEEIPSSQGYRVRIGSFNTAFEAGETAFALMNARIISDYSIISHTGEVPDIFANIIFVGSDNGVPSLFRYNLRTNQIEKVWHKNNEKIVDFTYAKGFADGFFITATDFGRKSIFPFISNVRVYKLNVLSLQAERLKNLGSGIQLFTDTEIANSYRVVLNSFDRKISTYVNQQTMMFDLNGNMVDNKKMTFDLVKENFPPPPDITFNYMSPGNLDKFIAELHNNKYSYSIFNYKSSTSKPIITLLQKLSQLEWSQDGKFLIFSTLNISPLNKSFKSGKPETSGIFVYSVDEAKIKFKMTGAGYKNFTLRGNLLFFDSGFGDSSQIFIYDIKLNKIINTVNAPGGCGIRNIPTIPDFGL